MTDVNMWRAMGAKELLAYISTAKGEQHDAVVYDTGYEFDASNPDALRFVASVAMTKASEDGEDFITEMPRDNSVISRFETPTSPVLLTLMQDRASREDASDTVYVPDSEVYCKRVENALMYRRIHIDDMTEAEKNEFEESLNKAKRSDFWYMVLHYYLPTAFAALTLIYIIIKFTQ